MKEPLGREKLAKKGHRKSEKVISLSAVFEKVRTPDVKVCMPQTWQQYDICE